MECCRAGVTNLRKSNNVYINILIVRMIINISEINSLSVWMTKWRARLLSGSKC